MAPFLGVDLACERVLGVLKVLGVEQCDHAEKMSRGPFGAIAVSAFREYGPCARMLVRARVNSLREFTQVRKPRKISSA